MVAKKSTEITERKFIPQGICGRWEGVKKKDKGYSLHLKQII